MESILIKIIFIYSAIKINANLPLLNSTLNPETNSDSPSAKSNGVRLVSANVDVNQARNKGIDKKINGVGESRIVWRLNEFIRMNTFKRIKDILTSYEIVCATARRAPKRLYLELEDHPAPKMVYTVKLDRQRK